MAVVVHLPGARRGVFTLGRWWAGATKGLVARDVCGDFKEWFPAAHHSYPPVKGLLFLSLSLSFPLPAVLSARVFTPWVFRTDLFREEERRETSAACPCPRRTIVLQRQITHLSGWRQNKGSCLAKNPRFLLESRGQDFAQITVSQTRLHLSILQTRWMPTLVRRIEPEFIQRESYFRKTQLKIKNRKLTNPKYKIS